MEFVKHFHQNEQGFVTDNRSMMSQRPLSCQSTRKNLWQWHFFQGVMRKFCFYSKWPTSSGLRQVCIWPAKIICDVIYRRIIMVVISKGKKFCRIASSWFILFFKKKGRIIKKRSHYFKVALFHEYFILCDTHAMDYIKGS